MPPGVSHLSENQNRQSLHATAAFVLAIDDMIMPAAADVVSAHLMNGNAVLELHFSVYQVALVSACRGAAMGHATKEVSQCPLP